MRRSCWRDLLFEHRTTILRRGSRAQHVCRPCWPLRSVPCATTLLCPTLDASALVCVTNVATTERRRAVPSDACHALLHAARRVAVDDSAIVRRARAKSALMTCRIQGLATGLPLQSPLPPCLLASSPLRAKPPPPPSLRGQLLRKSLLMPSTPLESTSLALAFSRSGPDLLCTTGPYGCNCNARPTSTELGMSATMPAGVSVLHPVLMLRVPLVPRKMLSLWRTPLAQRCGPGNGRMVP